MYTGCKSIWLDSNGFDKIENLDKMVELRCLYLGKNLITRIEGLESLRNLTILDLSNNRLSHVENLSCCPILQTVNLSHNALSTPESIAHFQECLALTTIDVTNNRLACDEAFFDVIQGIPALAALSINGNEITKLPTFRKRMIGRMPRLGYLDRPVDEQERFFANAFREGGAEAEAVAREEWKVLQSEKRLAQMAETKRWQEEQKRLRDEAKAEGRSLIREFTAEEQEERRREAQAAHEAEQRMLGHGLDRLGSVFHSMELRGVKGEDLLEQAAASILAQQREKASVGTLSAAAVEDLEDPPASSTAVVADESASNSHVVQLDDVQISVNTNVPAEVAAPESSSAVQVSPAKVQEETDAEEGHEDLEEDEEEIARQLRQQLVDESFAIYKRQQEDKKKGIHNQGYEPVSTWHAAPAAEPVVSKAEAQEAESPLFWTEAMDLTLAKEVQAQLYDFDAIAQKLQGLLKTDPQIFDQQSSNKQSAKLMEVRQARLQRQITSEACRLRWSALDAQQWCTLAPGVSAADTVFRINVSEEILAAGHQPSYEELMRLTAGLKPRYLQPPTRLPTMPSYANDSEEEKDTDDERDDGELEIFQVSRVTLEAAQKVSQRHLQHQQRQQPVQPVATVESTAPEEDASSSVAETKFEMDLD